MAADGCGQRSSLFLCHNHGALGPCRPGAWISRWPRAQCLSRASGPSVDQLCKLEPLRGSGSPGTRPGPHASPSASHVHTHPPCARVDVGLQGPHLSSGQCWGLGMERLGPFSPNPPLRGHPGDSRSRGARSQLPPPQKEATPAAQLLVTDGQKASRDTEGAGPSSQAGRGLVAGRGAGQGPGRPGG